MQYACTYRCDNLVFPDKKTSPYVLPYPVGKSYMLSQEYCSPYGHRNRIAYDFKMPFGAEITNARFGIVIEIQYNFKDDDDKAGHNNRVLIQHADNSIAWYGHLKYNSIALSLGDTVDYGELIGLCGTSGRSGNLPHLHFEVFRIIKYDYSNALPITFNNLFSEIDQSGALIRMEKYTALDYDKDKLIKFN